MNIIVRPTQSFVEYDGIRCRVWEGISPKGERCQIHVRHALLPPGVDPGPLEQVDDPRPGPLYKLAPPEIELFQQRMMDMLWAHGPRDACYFLIIIEDDGRAVHFHTGTDAPADVLRPVLLHIIRTPRQGDM